MIKNLSTYLLMALISCPETELQWLSFHVSQYLLRNCPTFLIPIHRTSYGYNNSIDRISRERDVLKNFNILNIFISYKSVVSPKSFFFKNRMYSLFVNVDFDRFYLCSSAIEFTTINNSYCYLNFISYHITLYYLCSSSLIYLCLENILLSILFTWF